MSVESTRRANAQKHNDEQAAIAQSHRDRIRRELQPGESLIAYCHDTALCDCEPVPSCWVRRGLKAPLDIIVVGRNRRDGYDRCLLCGEKWTIREYRWTPAYVLSVGSRSADEQEAA